MTSTRPQWHHQSRNEELTALKVQEAPLLQLDDETRCQWTLRGGKAAGTAVLRCERRGFHWE